MPELLLDYRLYVLLFAAFAAGAVDTSNPYDRLGKSIFGYAADLLFYVGLVLLVVLAYAYGLTLGAVAFLAACVVSVVAGSVAATMRDLARFQMGVWRRVLAPRLLLRVPSDVRRMSQHAARA
jgi:hypothetical protein